MNVGELAAYLTLDDSQFNAGLGRAKTGLSGISGLAKAAGQAASTLFTTGAASATAMGVALVKAGANYNILQQNSRAALMTLLGSQEKVNAQMEKLDELTSRSPFGKDTFITAQQQLISFGMAAEKVVPTLDAVQNAVAATGGSSQQLSEITYVLAQVQAAGKVTATDLMQLGQRGVDAATLVGSQMGKTGAEVREMITKGKLSASDFIDYLTKGMTAKFGGATDLIKQQWSGAADRIKAAWRDTGAVIAKPFIDPNGGGQAVVWGNLVADTMRSAQRQVTTAMTLIEATAGPTFQKISGDLAKVNTVVSQFNLADALGQLQTLSKYTPLISGAAGALVSFGLAPVPGLKALSTGMAPVLVGMAALVAASPELRGVGSAFTDALSPAVPMLAQGAKGAADLAMTLIDEATPGLTSAATGAGEFLANLAPLIPMAVDAASSLTPLVSGIADLAGWVANLPTPLLASAAAIAAFHSPLGKASTGLVTLAGKAGDAAAGVSLFLGQARQTGVIDAAKQSLSGFGASLAGIASPAGLVSAGLVALTAVVAAYAAEKAQAKAAVQSFVATLDEETGAITSNSRAQVAASFQQDGTIEKYREMGGNVRDLTDAALGNAQAQERVNKVTGEWYNLANGSLLPTLDRHYTMAEAVSSAVDKQSGIVSDSQQAWEDQASQMDSSTDAASRNADAIQTLIDKQNQLAGVAMSVDEAQGKWAEQVNTNAEAIQKLKGYTDDAGNAVAGLGSAVNATGTEWSLNTEAGRLANSTMIDTSKRAWDVIDSLKTQGATQEQLTASMVTSRNEFINTAQQMGLNRQAAERLADKYNLIPNNIVTTISANDQSSGVIKRITTTLAGLPRSKTITIYTDHIQIGRVGGSGMTGLVQANGGIVKYLANGGLENHVAQIAPAGAWRVWAEDETGGEGYIPLAQAKRRRSELIMGQIADKFGGMYIPANRFQTRANGGVDGTTATATRAPTAVSNVWNVTIDAHDLEGLKSIERFMQAIGYQRRMNGFGGGH